MKKDIVDISAGALDALESYAWPGNVRELQNVIERAVALEATRTVQIGRLPRHVLDPRPEQPSARLEPGFSLEAHLRDTERTIVFRALEQVGGSRVRAVDLLGISERSIRYLIKKHGLPPSGRADKS